MTTLGYIVAVRDDGVGMYYPTQPPPPRRPRWPLISVVVTAVLVAVFIVVANVIADDDTPAPISRAELLAQYAEIAPGDRSATPDAVDELAGLLCQRLDRGETTDDLIETATTSWGSRATQVVQLLISYGCPRYLDDFA